MLQAMVKALAEMYPHIPLCMHQDHGNSQATCMTAIQYGFTSVMMDGSLEVDAKTPASYDYNLAITNQVTQMAHHAGVSVEGELGVLGSLETGEGEQEDGHGAEGKLLRNSFSPTLIRQWISSGRPRSMRWPLPWEPVTAPINSPASRMAIFWR